MTTFARRVVMFTTLLTATSSATVSAQGQGDSSVATARDAVGLTIVGRVSNTVGAPIAGVTLVVSGTSLSAQTSDDGRYTLRVPGPFATGRAATLTARVISYRP